MKILLLAFFFLGSLSTYAQTSAGSKDSTVIFNKVEVEASFPGGEDGWLKYIIKALTKHMNQLTRAGNSGTCRVKFVVDKDGNVSNVVAMSMQGTTLAEIAVKVISKGPKWVPAMQDGRHVNAYRIQPITFKMPD